MWNEELKKIIIIGCPGSGKSYFARQLRDKLSLPLYYLDCLYWKEGWVTTPKEEFIEKTKQILETPAWIIDGNYRSTLELRMKACDVVFFLDYPASVCLEAEKARRGQKREDLPDFLEEQYDPEFEQYIMDFSKDNIPYIKEVISKNPDKKLYVFHNREEKEAFLKII